MIKPSISGGGRATARYARPDEAAAAHLDQLHVAGRTAMVQEYLTAIECDGELDLVFIGGRFSHAVKKAPQLATRSAGGLPERPWEQMVWWGRCQPDRRQLDVAYATFEAVRCCIGHLPVYGRVDLVPSALGEPLVLEVELIDPYLSLDARPAAADQLAAAILATSSAAWRSGSSGTSR